MAFDDTTTASDFFKTKYRHFMADDTPKASALAMQIEKDAKAVTAAGTSLNATWQHKSADGVGMGTLTDGSDYPQPVSSVPKQFSLGLAHCAFTVGFTGHLKAQGKSKEASWTGDYVQMKAQELRDKAKSLWARFLLNDGTANFGTVASVSGTTNGYITVTGAPIHYFIKNETLTIRDAASGGAEQLTGGAGSGRIVDIDYDNDRIYMANVTGAAVGDYVALSGFYDATVPNGIQNIVASTGTIQGLNRATAGNFFARAVYVDASSAALTADHIDSLRDDVWERSSLREGSYSHKWVGTPQMRRWMAQATIGYNRFTNLDMTLGTPHMKVGDRDGDKTMIEDQFLKTDQLFACDFKKWVLADPENMKGGYPVENAGSVFWQANASSGVGHADKQLMYWVWRRNVGCDMFHCQGQRDNIAAP